jgi:hypothetical protein
VSYPTKVLPYVVFGNVGAASAQALASGLVVISGGRSFVLQFTTAPVGRTGVCNFAMVLTHI